MRYWFWFTFFGPVGLVPSTKSVYLNYSLKNQGNNHGGHGGGPQAREPCLGLDASYSLVPSASFPHSVLSVSTRILCPASRTTGESPFSTQGHSIDTLALLRGQTGVVTSTLMVAQGPSSWRLAPLLSMGSRSEHWFQIGNQARNHGFSLGQCLQRPDLSFWILFGCTGGTLPLEALRLWPLSPSSETGHFQSPLAATRIPMLNTVTVSIWLPMVTHCRRVSVVLGPCDPHWHQ